LGNVQSSVININGYSKLHKKTINLIAYYLKVWYNISQRIIKGGEMKMSGLFSFLLGVNIGINLSKYFYKERTLFDLLFSIALLAIFLLGRL